MGETVSLEPIPCANAASAERASKSLANIVFGSLASCLGAVPTGNDLKSAARKGFNQVMPFPLHTNTSEKWTLSDRNSTISQIWKEKKRAPIFPRYQIGYYSSFRVCEPETLASLIPATR